MPQTLYDENENVIIPCIEIAHRLARQTVGLLGRTSLNSTEGLWLEPCNGVHTIGMRFPIDVVYLDKHGCVLSVRRGIVPFRICLPVRSTRAMLELRAGTAESCAIQVGKCYHIRENH
ncbi:MAG: DUF192 domain-containing protein [Armatimonadetes bacterium]|nr:DUF192 domain-containing protein [Armatimonadota bacterium]